VRSDTSSVLSAFSSMSSYKIAFCPISKDMMHTPVQVNGIDYDEHNIREWIKSHDGKDPKGKTVDMKSPLNF